MSRSDRGGLDQLAIGQRKPPSAYGISPPLCGRGGREIDVQVSNGRGCRNDLPAGFQTLDRPWEYRDGMRAFLRELAAVAVAALVYYLVRGAVSDRADEAFQRARDILALERELRLDWELPIHEAILGSDTLIDLANGTYFWGHMPLLIALAVWLWRSHRDIWRRFRNALLISAAVGMASYFLFPTAPPRLMPELGYVDTLAARAAPAYQAQEVGLFVNPYAALPSLHVGWALLAGLAVWQTSRHPVVRAFAVAVPLSQAWAVVATANHWTLDAWAGIGVCAVAWVLARHLQRHAHRLRVAR